MMTAVTRAQREQYEEDGYYIERGLLEPDQVALLAREIKDTIASGTDGINFDNTRMDGKTLKGSGMYRKLALLGRRNPLVWDTYYAHPRVIAINREFLGDEVMLWFDSIFTKPARVGEATPWHQDIGLWTQTPPQKKNKPHYRDALTIWMAVDRADRSNGCLQVVPGSHKGPVVDHVRYPDSIHVELPRDQVADVQVDHIELEAGDAIVWHAHLWHYSPVNLSDRNRLGIAQVTLSAGDAAATGKHNLPALVCAGAGQPAPSREAERSAPG
ncbi:MAG: phytanoyl-CoA dioxygenase family protein [Caldilineaceae bacterium]|nr:phytanoyl-CoA dioxygenase family protein [Caldilineaceae bacterium]